MLYLQTFRISFAGRVRWRGMREGALEEEAKIGMAVGRRGGLMRRLSAMVLNKINLNVQMSFVLR